MKQYINIWYTMIGGTRNSWGTMAQYTKHPDFQILRSINH